MDDTTFRRVVESHFPWDTPKPVSEGLEMALRFFQENHLTALPQSACACISLAGMFEQQLALQPARREEGNRHRAITENPSAESTDRLQRILPTVKQVRQEVFGLENAPFASDADAATWIEGEGQKQNVALAFDARGGKEWIDQRPQTIKQQLATILTGIQEGIQYYLWLSGETAPPFQPQRPRLPYKRPAQLPDGTEVLLAEEYPVCPGSPLARLAEVSSALAQATGFTQLDVVRHLLLGTKPTLSRYRVHIRQAPAPLEDLEDLSAVINVFTPYLSDRDLRNIRHYLRHYMQSEQLKRLRAFHEQLRRLVDEHGPVPSGKRSGSGVYWQRFLQRWNREVHNKRQEAEQTGAVYTLQYYEKPDALRVAWSRLPSLLRVPRKKETRKKKPTPPWMSIHSDVVGDATAVERLRCLKKAGE
jgi:hypothetical protein